MTPLNTVASTSRGYRRSHGHPLKIWGQLADLASQQSTWSPSVDLFEDHQKFVLRFEMPGVNQDDLDIDLYEDAVVVKGKRGFDSEGFSIHSISMEDETSAFSKQVLLPSQSDVDQAEFALNNGVLTLTVPKLQTAPLQRIPVKFVE